MNENIFIGCSEGDQVALIHSMLKTAWIVPIVRIWGSGSIIVHSPLLTTVEEIVIGIDGEAFHVRAKGVWSAVPVVVDA